MSPASITDALYTRRPRNSVCLREALGERKTISGPVETSSVSVSEESMTGVRVEKETGGCTVLHASFQFSTRA